MTSELDSLRAQLAALDAEQADAREAAEAALEAAQEAYDAVIEPLDIARAALMSRQSLMTRGGCACTKVRYRPACFAASARKVGA